MSSLTKVRVEKNKKYITINLTAVEDPNLSWAAKGVHLYFMSRPPDWVIRTADLLKRSNQGRHALRSALNELKKNGYLSLEQTKGDKGQFIDNEYVIYETSQGVDYTKARSRKTCHSDNPLADNPSNGEADPLIINSSTNEQEVEINNNCDVPKNGTISPEEPNLPKPLNDHQILVGVLAKVMGMDVKIRSNAGRVAKLAQALKQSDVKPTEEIVLAKYGENGWYYKYHWAGKQGQLPSQKVITETWGMWPETKVNGANNGAAKSAYYDTERWLNGANFALGKNRKNRGVDQQSANVLQSAAT